MERFSKNNIKLEAGDEKKLQNVMEGWGWGQVVLGGWVGVGGSQNFHRLLMGVPFLRGGSRPL